ncbi:hypothetical protein [Pseudoduganella flava]|uniref:Uncharacterized protein n=1 Tax=Pseudoduganella flava TaxID=871742 RepID=A0ABX6FNJ1_9BURK|nr:hypothetical protein [Pseudoduganella flava]QGZ39125.1 hypothetical protein GO485_08765 [Pseudoduganella flava]
MTEINAAAVINGSAEKVRYMMQHVRAFFPALLSPAARVEELNFFFQCSLIATGFEPRFKGIT